MAFIRYANASVVTSDVSLQGWVDVAQDKSLAWGNRSAAKVVLQDYDPSQFLLSHCTIVASVDTEVAPGPLGQQMVDGFQINRRWSDYLVVPKTARFINNNCLVAGTAILMADGTEKPIEQVYVGDEVITHTGAVRKVTETFVHPFAGYLRRVRRLGDTRVLEVTPEHPFLAMVPATECACGCGTSLDRRDRKAACHRFQDYVRGHGVRPRLNTKPSFGWISAGLLAKGDFLSTPRLDGEESTTTTPGKARLLGYYLAEGFYHKQKSHRVAKKYRDAFPGTSIASSVDFSLNLDETDTLVADIQHLLLEEFGVGSSVSRSSPNGVTVHSHQSVELVSFFKEHAGEYARTKRVSQHVLRWPLALQRELVQAWIEGDGCIQSTAGGWVTVTSASSELISQMHLIFGRLGVFATRSVSIRQGRKRVCVANGGTVVVNDPTRSCTAHHLQIGSVHAATLLGGSHLEALFNRSRRHQRKTTLSFRVQKERTIFPIRSVEKIPFEGLVYNFETEVDHSYVANGVAVHNSDAWERKLLLACFRTFIGGENYVEHIQIPHLSKGKIIDAAARDIGDSVYVDILIATERKHQALINAILSGQLQTLSMGCSVEHTTCTKCGNVAVDETQMCPHIRYLKGTKFTDPSGIERRIAELCGHLSDEPGSVKFIEGSWVANPAFRGAVLRSILSPSDLPGLGQKLSQAFSQVPRSFESEMLAKAARSAQQLDFNLDDQGEEPAAPPKPAPNPLDKVVDEVVDSVRQLAIEKLRGEVERGKQPPPADVNKNNNLVKEALHLQEAARSVLRIVGQDVPRARRILLGAVLYNKGGWDAVRRAHVLTGPDMLVLDSLLEASTKRVSMAGDKRVSRTVLAVGGLARYENVTAYLTACQKVIGRSLTESEKRSLLDKGLLFSKGVGRSQ